MSPQKQAELLKSAHHIGVFARLIEIEYANDLVDTRFKQPTINQHRKRIQESADQIKKALNSPENPFHAKSQEHIDYEYTLELYRLLGHLTNLGLDVIKSLADQLEKHNEGTKI